MKKEPHYTENGWCCACSYDILELNHRLATQKAELIKQIQDLITHEIAIAHTKDSGGKTSRLTSLFMAVSKL